MRTISAIILAGIMMLFLAGKGYSEEEFASITYNMGFPLGDTKDFVDDESFRGIGFQYSKFFNPNLSVGGSIGWNIFDERTDEMINFEEGVVQGSISGEQFRYINSVPILLLINYYVKNSESYVPYFGLGVGTYFIRQRFDIGVVTLQEDNWHFGLAPEAGVIFPIDYSSAITANFKYNIAFSAGESISRDDSIDYSYWGLNIGIAYFN